MPEGVYEAFVSRWRTAEKPTSDPVSGYYFEPVRHPRLSEPLDRMSYADAVTYLPDDLLVKVDRATMAVGLEGRAPLLDHEIVQFAWRIPASQKLRDGVAKCPLRNVLSKYVPAKLFDKPKQGFEPPLGEWLRGRCGIGRNLCLIREFGRWRDLSMPRQYMASGENTSRASATGGSNCGMC